MSIFTTDFESDAAGSFPAGFKSWTTPNPWTVQGAAGLHSLRNNSTEAYLLHSAVESHTNCIYRIEFNSLTTGNFRWFVFFRGQTASFGTSGVAVAMQTDNTTIEIYEIINSTWNKRAFKAWNTNVTNGFHSVEIALVDKSIAVYCVGVAGTVSEVNFNNLILTTGPYYGPVLWSNSNNKQFDNIHHIANNFTGAIRDDAFNNGLLDSQWTAYSSQAPGTTWNESTELKLSGTAVSAGYPSLQSPPISGRTGWYQEIKYKNITGWTNSQNIIFRLSDAGPNYYDLGINSGGYYLYKNENGVGTSSASKPLFGDEATAFHTLKMLWDEYHHVVWAWTDDVFIARIPFTPAYWADVQRADVYAYAPTGFAIDKRFKDFVARSTDQNLISVSGPFIANRPDITYDAFL